VQRRSLYSSFEDVAIGYPNKTAFIIDEHHISYQQLLNQSSQLAMNLSLNSVKQGEHIAVLLPNSIEFILIFLAAAKIGAVIVPYNTTFPPRYYLRSFSQMEIRHIVVWHALLEELTNATVHENAHARQVISVGGRYDDTLYFNDLLFNSSSVDNTYRAGRQDCATAKACDKDQAFIITLTSGSTGQPKPIVLSQETKLRRAEQAISLYAVSESDIIQIATPFYHSLAERLIFVTLLSGATAIIMRHFTASSWLEKARKYQSSFSIMVSSQLKQLLPIVTKSPLTRFRCIVSSSELLSSNARRLLIKSFNCDVHECYGTSEVAIVSNICIHSLARPSQKVKDSIGRAVDNVIIKLINEKGKELRDGERGEIICKTPLIFSGYFKKSDVTANHDYRDFFKTGDLAMRDKQGYLYFINRQSDVIITGGVNVFPKDIEDVLSCHIGISEVCVVPRVNERLGEVPVALVKVEEGAVVDVSTLKRLCAEELADYQQPHDFFIVDELARNNIGKIDRKSMAVRLNTRNILTT
jgi:long-chain acyl-CoA synthetase